MRLPLSTTIMIDIDIAHIFCPITNKFIGYSTSYLLTTCDIIELDCKWCGHKHSYEELEDGNIKVLTY